MFLEEEKKHYNINNQPTAVVFGSEPQLSIELLWQTEQNKNVEEKNVEAIPGIEQLHVLLEKRNKRLTKLAKQNI